MNQSTSDRPLVTLGVPVYNGEAYLAETLESLRAQDHGNLEIVISDNGSTDATPDICRDAASGDERIRYLRHEENRGGAWNFNHTVEQARGEYFKFAAADDVLLPTFVSSCVAALEDRGRDHVLAFPRAQLIDSHGTVFKDLDDEQLHIDQSSPRDRLDRYLASKAGHIVYAVVRTDVLRSTRGIRPVVTTDVVLGIELALRGKFALVPEQLFLQRRHDEQVSADGADMVQWYSPGRYDRLAFPFTAGQLECYRAVTSTPLSSADRARCIAVLTSTWVIPEWRAVASDVKRAVGLYR